MGTGIIVCGCNGSGKSTLGKALARALGYTFIDIEECYFPNQGAEDPYQYSLSHTAARNVLMDRIEQSRHFVLACVKGDYGEELLPLYRWAVYVSVPEEVRFWRIRKRSFEKFGAKALPGGELYAREKVFFEAAAARTEGEVKSWLHSLRCPVLTIDGTVPPEENAELILSRLPDRAPGLQNSFG